MRIQSEPCFPTMMQNFETCEYDSNWGSTYYSLDSRQYFNTFQETSYQPQDEEISNDLLTNIIRPSSIEEWNSSHIMSWIIELYNNEGFDYESVNMHLLRNCTGSEFIKFPESKFYEIHEKYAPWLYFKVKELAKNIIISESKSITFCDSDESIKPKKRGRPRSQNKVRRKSEHKTGKLWEFLRDLLLNPEYCPSLICWENHAEGEFRFVSSDKVAKIWGSKRGNTEMNYEKLSRAMRYYYKNEVLLPVLGKRLVYKFGPKAIGWRTTNPNFEY